MILIEDFGLSNSERIRLIRIDGRVPFSLQKDPHQQLFLMKAIGQTGIKRNVELKKLVSNKQEDILKEIAQNTTPNILSAAISNARKMNPKLGF